MNTRLLQILKKENSVINTILLIISWNNYDVWFLNKEKSKKEKEEKEKEKT